jgi:hypothetical protein
MAHPPEPYLPRRVAHIETWRDTGHAIKLYGIHRDPDWTGPSISDAVAVPGAAVHEASVVGFNAASRSSIARASLRGRFEADGANAARVLTAKTGFAGCNGVVAFKTLP